MMRYILEVHKFSFQQQKKNPKHSTMSCFIKMSREQGENQRLFFINAAILEILDL